MPLSVPHPFFPAEKAGNEKQAKKSNILKVEPAQQLFLLKVGLVNSVEIIGSQKYEVNEPSDGILSALKSYEELVGQWQWQSYPYFCQPLPVMPNPG